jgi:hypothetical protein
MRSFAAGIVGIATVLGLLLAPMAGAKVPTYRAEYTGQPVGLGCGGIVEEGDCVQVPNSAVQFGPFNGSLADFQIYDASGRRIGASLIFFDENQEEIGYGGMCGSVSRLEMPDNSTYVVITLDTLPTAKHCPGPLHVATSGEVLARFR